MTPPAPPRVALGNVRVFGDGTLSEPTTVVISGGLVSTATDADTVEDCAGSVLLPGLIDAHVHLHDLATMKQMADYGVTTALDMASWPVSFVDSCRGLSGLPDIRSALGACTVHGTTHSKFEGFPKDGILEGAGDAAGFVARRVAEGADYIKMVADVPGPDQALLDAVVAAAHEHGKMTITHASNYESYAMAVRSGTDVVTHVPTDRPLDDAVIDEMLERGQVAVPTLTMMQGIIEFLIKMGIAAPPDGEDTGGRAYRHAHDSVGALYARGVPVLVGTDANASAFAPSSPPHGESIHRELQLLVAAGLSTADALLGATLLPAKHFKLDDRGRVAPGLRGDLVLLAEDPLRDITGTRSIERVWCGGVEVHDRATI